MTFQICCRCLIKTTTRISKALPHESLLWSSAVLCAPFSSSAVAHANPTKPSSRSQSVPRKGVKSTFTLKKKHKGSDSKGKPPAPGERKAMRKRIVLSNTNAFEVPDMQDFGVAQLAEDSVQGSIVGIPGPVVDRLRAIEAFKTTQSWALFRRPGTLVRMETTELAKQFGAVEEANASQNVIRRIVVGGRGSGKSIYLLQAASMAFMKDWIVIGIPEAMDLTNAHTEYSPLPNTKPTMYFQKAYTAALLKRISAANPILSTLNTMLPHSLPIPLPENLSLTRLCELGSSDPAIAHPAFVALMAELKEPSRPPLLLTLDGLAHAMRDSEYKSASFQPIHAHSLYLVSWFMDHLSGKSSLPNGGMVLAATSGSNSPTVPTLNFRLEQLEAQQSLAAGALVPRADDPALPFLLATGQEPNPIPQPDPFLRHDQRVLDVLGPTPADGKSLAPAAAATRDRIEVLRMGGLPKDDARSLMEYWARSGMLRAKVDETLVGEKWIISGGGVVGELERGCVRMRL